MNTAEKLYEESVLTIEPVVCECGHRICDSEGVIRSRCIKLIEGIALCRCKLWVKVPIGKKEA